MRNAAWMAALALGLVGTLWAVDRGRRWESPRLEASWFDVVRGRHGAGFSVRGILLVPLNPGCPHCLASWRALRSVSRDGEPELLALLVDRQRPPPEAFLESLGASRIWWDRRGIWRRRWGHRIYGERMRFDASGCYLETLPPLVEP